ncbi:MAG: hypothetical protein QHH14_09465 [Clostridiales bacterium]|nr:hypothetical protein [Clostridiales bacterium]
MKRRLLFRLCVLVMLVAYLNLIAGTIVPEALNSGESKAEGGKKYPGILQSIYREVKEIGAYPGEAFVRGEFFVGTDDDDTNKDVHVSILIQKHDNREKMKIQVTYMEPAHQDPRVKYAGISKALVCLIDEKNIELESSDFKEKEIDNLAAEILRAVRNKKNLLSLCGSGRRG